MTRLAIYSGKPAGTDYIVHTADCRNGDAEIIDEYASRLDLYTAGYGGGCTDLYPYGTPPWYDECHKRGTAGVMWHACALDLPNEDMKHKRITVAEHLPALIDDIVGGDGRLADRPSSAIVTLFDEIVGDALPEHRRAAAAKFAAAFNTWLADNDRLPEGHYYDGLFGRYYCASEDRHRSCPKLPSLVDSANMWLNDAARSEGVAHIRRELVEESHDYAAHEIARSLCEAIGDLRYVPSVGMLPKDDRRMDHYMRATMTADPVRFAITDNFGREYDVTVEPRVDGIEVFTSADNTATGVSPLIVTSPAVPGVELTGAALDVLAALKTGS